MEAIRTCLGCRQRVPRSSLVRLVAREERVAVDAAARLPGRGAWVHPALACVTTAIQRKAIGRALRVTTLDTSHLATDLEIKAETANGQLMSDSK